MEIKQKTYLEVEKGDKKVQLVCDVDMPLGLLFDALMELKGFAIDRMAKSHSDEEKEAEERMGDPAPAEEVVEQEKE